MGASAWVGGMRLLNAVVFGVAVFSSIWVPTLWGGDLLTRSSAAIAACAFLLPPFLTSEALGRWGTLRMVRTAKVTNIVLSAFCCLVLGYVALRGMPAAQASLPVMLLVIAALNIRVLSRHVSEAGKVGPPPPPDSRYAMPMPAFAVALSSEDPAVAAEPALSRSYLMRHWRGDFSLPVSYWVNGALAWVAWAIVLEAFGWVYYSIDSLRLYSMLYVVIFCAVPVWSMWLYMGVWRAADRHDGRGGAPLWSSLARFTVIVCATITAIQAARHAGWLQEYAAIAVGNDPIGKIYVRPTDDGEAIVVTGTLREGAAQRVLRMVDQSPDARTLILNSTGGRLGEARMLADGIRRRALDTYVSKECSSACTYVLMAGRKRMAGPKAKIGFHRATSFNGNGVEEDPAAVASMLRYYRAAGLPEDFIARVGKTPATTFWYPSRDELIGAGVLSRPKAGADEG